MADATSLPGTEIQQAGRWLAEGEVDRAISLLEALANDFPAYVTAHVLLAKAYGAAGRSEDALGAWHRAYFLNPRSPLIIRQRRRLLAKAAGEDLDPLPAEEPVEYRTSGPDRARDDDSERSVATPDDAQDEQGAEVEAADQPLQEPMEVALEPDIVPEFEPEPESEPLDDASEIVNEEPEMAPQGWRLLGETPAPAADDEIQEAEIAPPETRGRSQDRAEARTETPSHVEEDPFLDEKDPYWDEDDAVFSEPPEAPEPAETPDSKSSFELSDQWVDIESELAPNQPTQPGPEEDILQSGDLDSLIEQLENAPRIQPQDSPSGSFEEDLTDEVVTVTLARIYEAQEQFSAAAQAYDRLASEQPHRADEFRQKAAEMRGRAEG